MNYHEGGLLHTAAGWSMLCECGHRTLSYAIISNAQTVHGYHQADNR